MLTPLDVARSESNDLTELVNWFALAHVSHRYLVAARSIAHNGKVVMLDSLARA